MTTEEIANQKIEEINKLFDSIKSGFPHLEKTNAFHILNEQRNDLISIVKQMENIQMVMSGPI